MNKLQWYCEYIFTAMEGYWHAVDAYLARQRGENLLAAEFDSASFEAQRKLQLMKWRKG
jgi:hypothetical protein